MNMPSWVSGITTPYALLAGLTVVALLLYRSGLRPPTKDAAVAIAFLRARLAQFALVIALFFGVVFAVIRIEGGAQRIASQSRSPSTTPANYSARMVNFASVSTSGISAADHLPPPVEAPPSGYVFPLQADPTASPCHDPDTAIADVGSSSARSTPSLVRENPAHTMRY
jgi:hypothetical protein